MVEELDKEFRLNAWYHELCARATLYPNKSIEEVIKLLNNKWQLFEHTYGRKTD